MVGQSSVQLFTGWIKLCQSVPWLDSAESNSQMVVNAVSNCMMAGQLIVQKSYGWTVLCPTVQWSDSAVPKSSIVKQCCGHLTLDGHTFEKIAMSHITPFLQTLSQMASRPGLASAK